MALLDLKRGQSIMDSLRVSSFLDLLDVALVSVLIYGVYLMVSRSRATRILAGLGAVGVMYLVARYLDLRLTVAILQAFFAVIIIALLVIFQDETRRLFERIGDQRWLSKRGYWGTAGITSVERRIQTLVDTASDLAQERIGALMVIEGDDNIGLLLSGGIKLNGIISESIIRSICDPHSQGHDGAIVVSGDTISRFACHLPLSAEASKLAGFGTRHAAGLGITERSDALSIIVSEERGLVTVARGGQLQVSANPADLAGSLREFFESTSRETGVGQTKNLITRNLLPKLISVVVAIVLWILVVLIPSAD
jgi:diadenylate cyclase